MKSLGKIPGLSSLGLGGLLAAGIAAAALPRCADTTSTSNGKDPRQLTLVSPSVADLGLAPSDQRPLQAAYRTVDGVSLPGERVRFAIFGDPKGSTLSADAAATNADGIATVQIRAGTATTNFEVRISADQATSLTVYVEVSSAGFGALRVKSSYEGQLLSEKTDNLRYLLFGGQPCALLDAEQLPEPQRTRAAGSLEEAVSFAALPLDVEFTLTALVYGANKAPRAMGCVELPGALLRAGQVVELMIVIQDLPLHLAGEFVLQSQLALPSASRPLVQALQPWSDLADCGNDPAQLVLDCVIDALDEDDPLDCLVAVPVSAEAQALSAQRGILEGGCREDLTATETPSLDRLLRQRMEQNASAELATLAAVEQQAAETLSRIGLQSRLTIGPLDDANRALAGHRLQMITFDDGARSASFAVEDIGLPLPWTDSVTVALVDGELEIQPHELTLGYGLVAREALGALTLAPAGLPADSPELARALATWVTEPGNEAGCPAIDAIVCATAGLTQGCLGQACDTGIEALAERLDAGFVGLFGPHADLRLGGRAPIADETGDRQIERLGDPDGARGQWSEALLDLGEDPLRPDSASFVGELAR